jgi:hypothetical protein
MQSSSIELKRSAEAARYALLRRLAPAMRHDMAGGFQPVTMLATIVEKRLLSATPDMSTLVKNSQELRTLAIAATHASLDLMGWITVEPEARVALGKGIADAVHLVATELSFKGIRFVNQTQDDATVVKLAHLRGVFMAALLAMADSSASSANLNLSATQDGQDVLVTVLLADVGAAQDASSKHDVFQLGLTTYRKIEWADVQAMADMDGLTVMREAGRVTLRLPISVA